MRDYLQPEIITTSSYIVFPLNAGNVDLKPGIIKLLPKFHGLNSKSLYAHLSEFEEITNTFQFNDVFQDVIKLKLFPFSLKDKAKSWLQSLKPQSIGTWAEMTQEFLKKYFSIHKTNAPRQTIMNFSQKVDETFFQCWERFKDFLLECPHHGYEK